MSRDFEDDRPDDRIRPPRTNGTRPGSPQRERSRRREEYDDEPAPRSSGSGGLKTVLIVLSIVLILGCCTLGGGGLAGILYFRGKVQGAAERQYTANNYKQIAIAFHNYEMAYGHLPPVAMKTRDGQPGLSWRVEILPFLEQESLYRQFKVNEAWNHPDNMRAAAQMPMVYAPRRDAGGDRTHVRAFYGPGAVFDPRRAEPRRLFEIMDGTSNTIFVVEAQQPVLWIQPDELPFDPRGSLPPLGQPENDYFFVALCDGSVRRVKKSADPQTLKNMITADGGEVINDFGIFD